MQIGPVEFQPKRSGVRWVLYRNTGPWHMIIGERMVWDGPECAAYKNKHNNPARIVVDRPATGRMCERCEVLYATAVLQGRVKRR